MSQNRLVRSALAFSILGASLFAGGCASIVNSGNREISIRHATTGRNRVGAQDRWRYHGRRGGGAKDPMHGFARSQEGLLLGPELHAAAGDAGL